MIKTQRPRVIISNKGLETHNISKSYKKRPILRNVTMKVTRGEIVGLLGPNGAGKTTLFNIIMGLISPDYGNIKLY